MERRGVKEGKELVADDYIAFGLACCFVLNSGGKLDGKGLKIMEKQRIKDYRVLDI